ncbi:MAG: serine protease Do [Verrucomicrobiota bacterium]
MNANKALRSYSAAVLLISIFSTAACKSHSASANYQPLPVIATSVSSGVVPSYADVVDRVVPAVVTIRSARRVRAPQQFPFSDNSFFRKFFGQPERQAPPEDQSSIEHALGSGVIVTADGRILTNHHVVDGAEEITVELSDRRSYAAKLIGSDAPSDLALLKIAAVGLPLLALADSDKVRVGDICLAVGNPLGIGETVTAGIISAKGRSTGLSDGSFEDFLQTDAAINRGNSGGALVNLRAELTGINSQIISPTGGNIGIGFAIPSNMARTVMGQLSKQGTVQRGRLGVGIQSLTSELAASMGLKELKGVLVNVVEPASPAEQAGIHVGDIIVAFNGIAVNDPNTLRNLVASTLPGTEVKMTVLRDGRYLDLQTRIADLPSTKAKADAGTQNGSADRSQLGLRVEPLTPDAARQLGLRGTSGVVIVDVDPYGPAASAGLQPQDVILEVNHQLVRSAADVKAALRKSEGRPALLLVNHAGRNAFVTVLPGVTG